MDQAVISKLMDRNAELIIKRLLGDRCTVYPSVPDNMTITGPGIMSGTSSARVWRGTTSIPCLIEPSRAFRPAALPAQNTEVDEFNLHLPYDFPCQPTDRVHIADPTTGVITVHVIRKMTDKSRWRGTREVTITELGVNDEGA
jgi:hypothetical protein